MKRIIPIAVATILVAAGPALAGISSSATAGLTGPQGFTLTFNSDFDNSGVLPAGQYTFSLNSVALAQGFGANPSLGIGQFADVNLQFLSSSSINTLSISESVSASVGGFSNTPGQNTDGKDAAFSPLLETAAQGAQLPHESFPFYPYQGALAGTSLVAIPTGAPTAPTGVHLISGNGAVISQPSGASSSTTARAETMVRWTFELANSTPYTMDGIISSQPPGSSSQSPMIPQQITPNHTDMFLDVPSGLWFDPPSADGFEYNILSTSLFTRILNFPSGFGDALVVSVNGQRLAGVYGPGDTVDFTMFPGGGVSEFTIDQISPSVDAENLNAFPLQLEFNTPTADFSMTPTPEPAVPLYIASFALWLLRRTYRSADGGLPRRRIWL